MKKSFLLLPLLLVCISVNIHAGDIALPEPQKTGGEPVFEAIGQRRSHRDFSDEKLDMQTISDILWVAYGFNHEDKRVVPTALNKQELVVYAVLEEGVYLYDAKNNFLLLKVEGDYRHLAGTQEYVHSAPLNLIYAAEVSQDSKPELSYLACGCAVENVYLACVSKGLGCVVRASLEKEELCKTLKLNDNRMILMGQTIGRKK